MAEPSEEKSVAATPPAAPAPAAAPGPAPVPAVVAAPPARRRRRWWRLPLMLLLPAAIVIGGGYYWVTGGRWVSTENAYVQQDKVTIAPEVEGRIAAVNVAQNQTVAPGDVLFRLDDATYRIALEKADSAVAAARLQVEQLRVQLKDAELQAATAKETLAYQQTVFDRQEKLRGTGNTTLASFDQARHDLDLARQAAAQADQAVAGAVAALGGDPSIPTDRHPTVLAALAARDQAALDLAHTVVKAPAAGVVAQVASLQVGQYLASGTPVAALVETGSTWVEANFKETDLEHMKVGQTAELTLDAYPGKSIEAHVDSIGAGTGATFAILPAQNATGNWVKVVQRVPVRIALDDAAGVPLRSGLSVSVDVDTGYVRPLPAPVRNALAAVGIDPALAREASR